MKKLTLVTLAILGLSTLGYANCGNDNGNGNGCSGNTGPQGPQGPQGPVGLNGTNGSNGANGSNGTNGANGSNGTSGVNGKDGRNGTDAQVDRSAKLALDAAIRLYDGKYVQVQAFNIYLPSRKNNQDVIGDGTNFMFGARVVFKLGRSYEERRIDELEKKLKLLSR